MLPKRFIHYSLLFLGAAVMLTSCLDEPNFPDTPEISSPSFNSYEIVDLLGNPADSLVISVRFKDGDGDLGVTSEERRDTVVRYKDWGNYQLRTFRRLTNGQFQEIDLPVNKRLFFPRLKKDDKAGPLEGTLDFSQTYFRSFAKPTVVKFRIRIRDRALRASNEIETDTVTVPFPF